AKKHYFSLNKYDSIDQTVEDIKKSLGKLIEKKSIYGFIIIPKDIFKSNTVEYHARSVSSFIDNERISGAISKVVNKKRLEQEGLDPIKVENLTKRINLKAIKFGAPGETEEKGQTFAITYILVMIIYMSVLLYGIAVQRSVLEEKSSRIVEIIISSVKPFQLMLGKILGVGTVGLTQFIIWGIFGIGLSKYSKEIVSFFSKEAAEAMPGMISIPAHIFIFFIVYFILGYFMFACFYAAIGSMVNTEEEAQQLQIPIIGFLVIPILLLMYIINSPDSTVSVVLSLIPFFTPILMFCRICVLTPPALEIAISILILTGTIVLLIWLVSKIYRVGILMYGKKPTFAEVVKWIKYS
ncbi:hypothetical protein DRQ09_09945, partial [candidate division KSB1 bacterium]